MQSPMNSKHEILEILRLNQFGIGKAHAFLYPLNQHTNKFTTFHSNVVNHTAFCCTRNICA